MQEAAQMSMKWCTSVCSFSRAGQNNLMGRLSAILVRLNFPLSFLLRVCIRLVIALPATNKSHQHSTLPMGLPLCSVTQTFECARYGCFVKYVRKGVLNLSDGTLRLNVENEE